MTGFLIALGVALVLDLLLGDPHSRFHPVALFGRAAGKIESFCRRTFGDGILSKGIHQYLSRRREVKDFYFAHPSDGGMGKTYVELF